jgi:hypothetical protein
MKRAMSEVELFKELGTYERHFNQMQNVCRGFASTWLLAVFGGFGYIIANKTQGILDWTVSGSLVALSGITGIFLLWVLDVLVYHNLLLAVIDARSGILKLDFTKKTVVPLFGKFPKAMLPSVRYAISLFYGIPGAFLFFVAVGLNTMSTINGVVPAPVTCAIWVVGIGVFARVAYDDNNSIAMSRRNIRIKTAWTNLGYQGYSQCEAS